MTTFVPKHPCAVCTLLALAVLLLLSGCSSAGPDDTNVTQSVPGGGGGGGPTTPVGTISDPLFAQQWHLQNTGQGGGVPGEDARVMGVWNQGIGGKGVLVGVVDDGLEVAHEDLGANILLGQSFNYLTRGGNPTSATTGLCKEAGGEADCHGTSVAGVIAAGPNQVGGRGAAPSASLVGYNLLGTGVVSPDSLESDAMTRNASAIWVSNNSWGAPDDGKLHPSGPLWKAGVLNGLAVGRGGRGTIYVWAGGNGGSRSNDNSNYEGYANFRGVMAICAVNAAGTQPSYSDPGANLWGCTPSSSGGSGLPGVLTTDRSGGEGYNRSGTGAEPASTNYTNSFGGTSSSTALASGIVALVLESNPALGWRDVRGVLAETARKNDSSDADWATNGAGYALNHKYGFGVFNAEAAVARAKTWVNLGPQRTFAQSLAVNQAVPDLGSVSSSMAVAGSGITRIEWIEIELTANHQSDGDLEIVLRNNNTGMVSVLAQPRVCPGTTADRCGNYDPWTFSSARHLGEAADGQWTLSVRDGLPQDLGTVVSWKLTFYGT